MSWLEQFPYSHGLLAGTNELTRRQTRGLERVPGEHGRHEQQAVPWTAAPGAWQNFRCRSAPRTDVLARASEAIPGFYPDDITIIPADTNHLAEEAPFPPPHANHRRALSGVGMHDGGWMGRNPGVSRSEGGTLTIRGIVERNPKGSSMNALFLSPCMVRLPRSSRVLTGGARGNADVTKPGGPRSPASPPPGSRPPPRPTGPRPRPSSLPSAPH
ncbi:hypothetical protein CYFUS_005410 [Cystobacter fuscus]|uniref:Uncharacterized protein n=1 Tax=Cystobacter fuscus TaxID=43 RepID=A0A250J918_9BACT|nr:hypothetical protein CYFUS_005410 [Cystobacter fuscus]